MNTMIAAIKTCSLIFILSIFSFACSSSSRETAGPLYLSGKVIVDARIPASSISGPTMVAITRTDDFEAIENDFEGMVINVITVNPDLTFSTNIAEKGLAVGDTIYLFAFIDNDYANGLPRPTQNDFLGAYGKFEGMTLGYRLGNENSGIEIVINRKYYDFESSINGKVEGTNDTDSGNLYIAAYRADLITSLDYSNLTMEGVLGFRVINNIGKNDWPVNYHLDIFPYLPYRYCNTVHGKLTVDRICLMVMLDANQNNIVDEGDKYGIYYTRTGNDYSIELTAIDETAVENIDVSFLQTVKSVENPYNMSLTGSLQLPEGSENYPAYIIIADATYLETVEEDLFSGVKYFSKLEPGVTSFNINMAGMGLTPDDPASAILIVGLVDKDNTGLFPNPTIGDLVGLYVDAEAMTPSYIPHSGTNDVGAIGVNRKIVSLSAQVSGVVNGNDQGTVTIVAYTGEIPSASIFSEINYDSIIGYRQIEKGKAPVPYTMDILPYLPGSGEVPVRNVCIYSFIDKNDNGRIDEGDKVGFHTTNAIGFPTILTIEDGLTENIDIDFLMEMGPPGESHNISLEGTFQAPEGYTAASKPIFLIIADASTDLGAFFTDPFSAIRYYKRMAPGETHFNLDLSSTGLAPGDRVMVVAFWDKDFNGVYPEITGNDHLGYYQNKDTYALTIALAEGKNSISPSGSWHFDVNKIIYDFYDETNDINRTPTIKFQLWNGDLLPILGNVPNPLCPFNTQLQYIEGDQIIMIAVQGNGIFTAGTPADYKILDIDFIIGYSLITVNADSDHWYSMEILPLLHEDITLNPDPDDSSGFYIKDVYLFAVIDGKTLANPAGEPNGWPDSGEPVGYFWEPWILGLGSPPYLPKSLWVWAGENKLPSTDDDPYYQNRVRFSCFVMP